MSDTPAETTWLTDVDGNQIGLQVITSGDERVVRLMVPAKGIDKSLSIDDARRLVEVLQQGIAFVNITGATSIRLDADDL